MNLTAFTSLYPLPSQSIFDAVEVLARVCGKTRYRDYVWKSNFNPLWILILLYAKWKDWKNFASPPRLKFFFLIWSRRDGRIGEALKSRFNSLKKATRRFFKKKRISRVWNNKAPPQLLWNFSINSVASWMFSTDSRTQDARLVLCPEELCC